MKMNQKPSNITVLIHEKYLFLENFVSLIFLTKQPFLRILSLILKLLYSIKGSWRMTHHKQSLQKMKMRLKVL